MAYGGAARSHAFFYDGEKMIDLNSLVDPSSGWTLVVATAINDLGQIAGSWNGARRAQTAFLLTPIVVQASRLRGKAAGACPTTGRGKEGIAMT